MSRIRYDIDEFLTEDFADTLSGFIDTIQGLGNDHLEIISQRRTIPQNVVDLIRHFHVRDANKSLTLIYKWGAK